MRFQATPQSAGPGQLFIELPFDPKEKLGRARPKVVVTLNGHSWRSTVFPYSGRFLLSVRKSNRDAAGVKLGDRVKVTLELDTEPRIVEPPPQLKRALARNKVARAGWEALSYTHQLEHADAIAKAKKPETRERRLEKTVAMLVEKSKPEAPQTSSSSRPSRNSRAMTT